MPCGMKGIFLPDGSPIFYWHNTLSIHYCSLWARPDRGTLLGSGLACPWHPIPGDHLSDDIFSFGKASWDSFPNRKDIDKPSGICLFWSMAIAFTPVYSLLRTVTASMSPSKINHNLPESHIFMPLNSERLGNVMKWGQSMQQNFNLIPLRRIFFMQKYSLRFAHLTSVTTRA